MSTLDRATPQAVEHLRVREFGDLLDSLWADLELATAGFRTWRHLADRGTHDR